MCEHVPGCGSYAPAWREGQLVILVPETVCRWNDAIYGKSFGLHVMPTETASCCSLTCLGIESVGSSLASRQDTFSPLSTTHWGSQQNCWCILANS